MSAQTVAPRSSRPKRAEPDDIVLARALEFSHWARANIRLIVIGAVVVLMVVAGLLWWRAEQADRRERAAAEFMQLEQTVASGNTALAARDLGVYIARFDGTAYADEARVMLARLQLDAGQPQAAMEAVDELAARPGASTLATQGAFLYAAAQEAAGQTDGAVETYLRIADAAELPFQRVEALGAAAALRAQSGDPAGAAELYRRAVALTEEGTTERTVYEMRLAEAEAAAAAEGG